MYLAKRLINFLEMLSLQFGAVLRTVDVSVD